MVGMLPFSHQEIQKASSSSRKADQGANEKTSLESHHSNVPLFLQYPVPYTQDAPTPLLVSQSPSKLHFGNPYSIADSKGGSPFQKATQKMRLFPAVVSSPESSPCRRGR